MDTYLAVRQAWLDLTSPDDQQPLFELFIMLSLGAVAESDRQDRLALAQYNEARQLAEELPPGHPARSIAWAMTAGVYANLGDYELALVSFERAKQLRLLSMHESHPDVASLTNNIAVCLDMTQHSHAALGLYEQAKTDLLAALGDEHPRTFTVKRNIEKCRHRYHVDVVAVVPAASAVAVHEPIKKKKKKRTDAAKSGAGPSRSR